MAFDSVKPTMKDGLSDVSNFKSGGYLEFISGFKDCKIELSGPYDQGGMAITLGSSVTVTVGYSASVNLTVPGIVEQIGPDIKAKDAERIAVSVQSSGSFTPSVT